MTRGCRVLFGSGPRDQAPVEVVHPGTRLCNLQVLGGRAIRSTTSRDGSNTGGNDASRSLDPCGGGGWFRSDGLQQLQLVREAELQLVCEAVVQLVREAEVQLVREAVVQHVRGSEAGLRLLEVSAS